MFCFYYFFPRGISYGMGGRINFGEDSFNRISEVLVPFLRLKSDRGQLAPLSTPFLPHIHQINFFMIAILLKQFKSQITKTPVRTKPSRTRHKRYNLCSGAIYDSYGRDTRISFREGSFGYKLKVLVHFKRVKEIGGQISPPPTPFPQMHQIKIMR